ncbi:hypothetical protein [Agrilutibacter solisilvae]|uniref:Uncharacterized protein n=1 Tax=Agrilutibacter solisilvae TaxID=2763317 RepID=A0A974Y3D6_9GAMM|nr:hypothetical protein [Lysobacter solisilvae]QSX79755.1 hypothetical protein I8J32_007955 [Lysobacter solisilvae]
MNSPLPPQDEPGAGVLERDEDFVDLSLPIEDAFRRDDGGLTVIARGRVHGLVRAFAVDLEPAWTPQLLDDSERTLYWGGGCLRSVGEDSDAFLALLASAYGLDDAGPMVAQVAMTIAGTDSDPARLRSEPARLRLIFEADDGEDAAEAYLNLDLDEGLAVFRDKDPLYHAALLRALSAQDAT